LPAFAPDKSWIAPSGWPLGFAAGAAAAGAAAGAGAGAGAAAAAAGAGAGALAFAASASAIPAACAAAPAAATAACRAATAAGACRRGCGLHRRGAQHHRLLEIGLLAARGGGRLADELQLVLAKLDDVVVLQEMLLDRVAVDDRAVGAAQVFQERVVED